MFEVPAKEDGLTQGDIFSECPIIDWERSESGSWVPSVFSHRVIVLTQACDLANQKTTRIQVAVVHDVRTLVASGFVKPSTVRDQIRTHRVYGLYFLPEYANLIEESIVDLRDIHVLPRELLDRSAQDGKKIARLTTPYREHLAQHFATTYSRIALPQPYESNP